MVIIPAPENAALLFHPVLAASGRECAGIAGPFEQIRQVLRGILEKNLRPARNGRDTLFSLSPASV